MKRLLATFFLFIPLFIGCSQEQNGYSILFPINSNTQSTYYFKSSRFVSADTGMPVSITILNNPVTKDSFADILITAQNNTDAKMRVTSLAIRSKFGPVKILRKTRYEHDIATGRVFSKPADFKKYVPKMQEYGCAPPGSKDTITEEQMNLAQNKLIHFYTTYQNAKKLNTAFYYGNDNSFNDVWVQFFRINLPKIPKDEKRLTLLLEIGFSDKTTQKFKLVLQKI